MRRRADQNVAQQVVVNDDGAHACRSGGGQVGVVEACDERQVLVGRQRLIE